MALESDFMKDICFSRELQENYNLQNKHLFKKKTGNAKWYYQLIFDETLDNDLNELHKLYNQNIPFKIFGMHTNMYITDNGYDGLFVDISPKNSTISFNKETELFTVSSNVAVSKLVNYAMELGYDFAALTGIPGLVGSGVVGNSSFTASGKGFSDFVYGIKLYDFNDGKTIDVVPNNDFFGDRDSFMKQQNRNQTRFFVKEIILKGDYIGKEAVKEKYDAQMERRKVSLKFGFLEGSAGSLWSPVHLKKQIGKSFSKLLRENPSINANFNGATYSPNGAMFFTTGEKTTDKDVAKLFVHTLEEVKKLYNVDLHKEVFILDYDGEIDLETFISRNT